MFTRRELLQLLQSRFILVLCEMLLISLLTHVSGQRMSQAELPLPGTSRPGFLFAPEPKPELSGEDVGKDLTWELNQNQSYPQCRRRNGISTDRRSGGRIGIGIGIRDTDSAEI
jgi:hypothetical protein